MSLSSSSSNSNAGRLVSSSMHFEDTNSQQVTLIPLEQDEVTLNSKREVSNNITPSLRRRSKRGRKGENY